MIPSSSALVSLKPARQAALQAIMTVEEARQRGARLPSMPHVRTFLRLLTGCSRINSDVARRIPGLHRDPKDRLSSLKQVEEALDMLISSHGEYCPLPLTMDVQAELFPEVLHTRTVRRLKRQDFAFTRKMRREARQVEQSWLLDWLRISGEPLYAVMYEIPFIVRETPEHIRVAERWQVPNKLADRSGV